MNYQKLLSKFNYMNTDTVEDDYFESEIDLDSVDKNPEVENKRVQYEISQQKLKNGEEILIVKNNDSSRDIKDELCEEGAILEEPIQGLRPEEVRWFYKSIQDKTWLEFSGYDSLRIEKKYRDLYKHHSNSILEHNVDFPELENGIDATDINNIEIKLENLENRNSQAILTNNIKLNSVFESSDLPTYKIETNFNEILSKNNKIPKLEINLKNSKKLPSSVDDNNRKNDEESVIVNNTEKIVVNGKMDLNGHNVGNNGVSLEEEDVFDDAEEKISAEHIIINESYNSKKNSLDSNSSKEDKFDPTRRIVVRGGMYEVDLINLTCESIYWPGEQCFITRGLFFYDGSWQPLEMKPAHLMEEKHLELFGGKIHSDYCTGGTIKTATVIHTENFTEYHVAWLSPNEIYLYSDNAPSKIVRSVTHRLGFQKSTGYRLKRGYRLLANDSDEPQGVSHLVFVIHGIGQKMDTGRIIRNTSAFRECVDWLKNKYFPSANQRAEFFPVEWRSSLKLDSDMVDAITPHNVMSIRHLLNCSAMDIMYYTSPLYGMEVQRGLTEELNRLYSMFLLRNPNFKGPVSILAHSLGSVILYDIVTSYQPGSCGNCNKNSPAVSTGLQFKIDKLFCLGSPLSVFIALRFSNPTEHDILPENLCNGMYNIFHLSDPVAYRMEPLLCREYRTVAPLMIQPYALAVGGVKYHEMPLEIIQGQAAGQESGSENASPVHTPGKAGSWKIWSYVKPPWNKGESSTASNAENLEGNSTEKQKFEINESSPSTSVDQCCLPSKKIKRLDYVLRETGIAKNYWSAITSHTSYWTNYDVAFFVLSKLFPDFENHQVEENADIFESMPI